MKRTIILYSLVLLFLPLSGCLTWNAKIDDMRSVYKEPDNSGAPRIIVTDLSDKRKDTKLVGRIAALNLATETPVNVIITNRIASKLKYAGFNIKKIDTNGKTKSELAVEIKRNDAKMLLTGTMDYFFIESMDAILETAKGRASFCLEILDEQGKPLFSKTYTVYTEKHIGLGGGYSSEELIKETIDKAVKEVFEDIDFQKFLLLHKK